MPITTLRDFADAKRRAERGKGCLSLHHKYIIWLSISDNWCPSFKRNAIEILITIFRYYSISNLYTVSIFGAISLSILKKIL